MINFFGRILRRRALLGGLVVAVTFVGLSGPAWADGDDATSASGIHLLYSFDECGRAAAGCADLVRDFSPYGNHGSVARASGGGIAVVPGWLGSAVRLSGAVLQVKSSASDPAFSPGTRAFSFGAKVKLDQSPGLGANLMQRGRFGAGRSQWKLQLDEINPGCAVQGDQGRMTAFAPEPLPVDGRWHSVTCVVTPQVLAFVVDGRVHTSPNTAGALTFGPAELVHVAGVFNQDGQINDPFRNPIDDVFLAG